MKRLSAIIIIFILSLNYCSRLDIVGNDSVRAFGEVLNVLPAESDGSGGWRMAAPDNNAWFDWDNHGISMIVDAQPFIRAGLDLNKLKKSEMVSGNNIIFMLPAFNMPNQDTQSSPLEQFKKAVRFFRKYIGYHMEMDHYNITIANGNMFEWAKDIESNDKDIVFVLNPEPLIAAGVDPENVDRWVYAQVKVHIDGKPADVWKFLKPFDLK